VSAPVKSERREVNRERLFVFFASFCSNSLLLLLLRAETGSMKTEDDLEDDYDFESHLVERRGCHLRPMDLRKEIAQKIAKITKGWEAFGAVLGIALYFLLKRFSCRVPIFASFEIFCGEIPLRQLLARREFDLSLFAAADFN
jgi:hypothetical protein